MQPVGLIRSCPVPASSTTRSGITRRIRDPSANRTETETPARATPAYANRCLENVHECSVTDSTNLPKHCQGDETRTGFFNYHIRGGATEHSEGKEIGGGIQDHNTRLQRVANYTFPECLLRSPFPPPTPWLPVFWRTGITRANASGSTRSRRPIRRMNRSPVRAFIHGLVFFLKETILSFY